MSNQLDILALEPYYGGFRREMLETLARNSRHRWKILKLPPRRLERRLTTAARWFAEQMSRHAVGHFDVLFTTETLNLADLYRLTPALSRKPSVVYFHSHQLGDSTAPDQPHDYANLSSASAATELWFISKFGRRDFFSVAQDVVGRDAELSAQDILTKLTSKSYVVAPPVEVVLRRDAFANSSFDQRPDEFILLNANGADLTLLRLSDKILRSRGISIRLKVIGSTAGLPDELTIESVAAGDPPSVARAVAESKMYLSVSPGCAFDENAVRALAIGRPTVLPRAGGYVEMVAAADRSRKMYAVGPETLADVLATRWAASSTPIDYEMVNDHQSRFDPLGATKLIDDRLRRLSASPN